MKYYLFYYGPWLFSLWSGLIPGGVIGGWGGGGVVFGKGNTMLERIFLVLSILAYILLTYVGSFVV